MNKKQVHTTDQVRADQVQPDIIPGQITAEEVLAAQTPASDTKPDRPARSGARTGTKSSKHDTPVESPKNGLKMGAGVKAGTGAQDNQVKSGASAGKSGAKSGTNTELAKSGTKQVRGRGKDKVPRKKRTDFNINAQVPPDERQIILRHNVELWQLGKLKNRNDPEEVRERIGTYFSLCQKNQQMPTVAGLALSFGIDRATLWLWMDNKTGVIKNPEVLDTLKEVYNLIASQYEGMLTQGKIIPVAGFFLMQNNFGYKNQTDHVVVAQAAEEPGTEDIAARAGLLDGDGAED